MPHINEKVCYMKKLILLVSILTLSLSCEKNMTTSIPIEINGTIQKQGITSYMYGTHFF